MRVQFRFAVVAVWSLVVSLPVSGWAAQGNETRAGVGLIASDQNVERPTGFRYDEIRTGAKPSNQTAPVREPSLKDLFFKPDQASSKAKTSDSIAVEPWLPGRGSVGVKVEVTW
jgi:hypothetical protein